MSPASPLTYLWSLVSLGHPLFSIIHQSSAALPKFNGPECPESIAKRSFGPFPVAYPSPRCHLDVAEDDEDDRDALLLASPLFFHTRTQPLCFMMLCIIR